GVAAVVDDRLVDAAKARAWICGYELEVERLDHVDHEVAAGAIGGEHLDGRRWIGLARRRRRAGCRRRRALRRSSSSHGSGQERCRTRHGRAVQKASTIDGMLLRHARSLHLVGPWALVLGAWSVPGPRSVLGPRSFVR